MQQNQVNPITNKLMTMDVESLKRYLNCNNKELTIAPYFNVERLIESLTEVCGSLKLSRQEVRALEIKLQELQDKINLKNNIYDSQYREQLDRIVLSLCEEEKNQILNIIQKQHEINLASNQAYELLKSRNEHLTQQVIQFSELPREIVQAKDNQKNQLIRDLENQYKQFYEVNQRFQKKLNTVISQQSSNQSDSNFIQMQSNSNRSRIYEQLKQEYLEIVNQAKAFYQKVQEKYQQVNDQQTKSNLQQMLIILQHSLKLLEKPIQIFDELRIQYEEILCQAQALQTKNQKLQKELNKETKQYAQKINELQGQFEQAKEKLDKQTLDMSLKQNYSKSQIALLSQESLKIHQKFYSKIEQKLPDLVISFMNISIQNILGNYFATKEGLMMDIQNKEGMIEGTKRFLQSIKDFENNRIEKLIQNSANFLDCFKNYFPNDQGDKQQKCFTKSYIFCQLSLDNLRNYLESIQKGAEEFKNDHAHFKQLESQMK